jgi:hypothetical protein
MHGMPARTSQRIVYTNFPTDRSVCTACSFRSADIDCTGSRTAVVEKTTSAPLCCTSSTTKGRLAPGGERRQGLYLAFGVSRRGGDSDWTRGKDPLPHKAESEVQPCADSFYWSDYFIQEHFITNAARSKSSPTPDLGPTHTPRASNGLENDITSK